MYMFSTIYLLCTTSIGTCRIVESMQEMANAIALAFILMLVDNNVCPIKIKAMFFDKILQCFFSTGIKWFIKMQDKGWRSRHYEE